VQLTLDVNGQRLLQREAPPSGLKRDGASAMYAKLVVPAGEQHITVTLSDDVRARHSGLKREAVFTLSPHQVLVIDYDAASGGITMQ
jgi:hypothetical protein